MIRQCQMSRPAVCDRPGFRTPPDTAASVWAFRTPSSVRMRCPRKRVDFNFRFEWFALAAMFLFATWLLGATDVWVLLFHRVGAAVPC